MEPWFKAHETIKRTLHIDLAYSGDGDALGMAMGHVPQMVDINGERKPYIVIDLLLRIKALPGGEIFLGDVRNWVYMLRDQLKFKIDVVTMDGFECLTGDTLVPCLDGTTRTMRELAENYPDGGVWTYSFNGSKIVPGRMKRAWRTATKKTIRVILDNGEQVRCTPDHPFMLRDGSYRSAVDLRYGDSLMPLYRRVTPGDWKGLRGYEQVLQPGPRTISSRHLREKGEWLAGRWQFTHRMVAGSVPKDHIDHHVDFNKLNNNPGNLRRMLLEDHLILHREHGSANFRRLWADDEFRQKTTEAIRKAMTGRTGIIANRRRHDVTIEMLQQQAHLSRREVTKRFGWSQDMIYARVREAGFNSWSEFRKSRLTQVNHKVIAVVDLNEIEDVYDLEIEDHHNFAIGSGIFVHNSTDTMQQLQRKRFHADYVSVDKQILPYHDLREALYEDRIDFPPYICNIHMESGSQPVEILVKELTELMDTGRKIDHPLNGSKDVADAVAGVTFTLMGDRRYHRNTASLETAHASQGSQRPAMAGASHPAFRGESGFSAPLPPNLTGRW